MAKVWLDHKTLQETKTIPSEEKVVIHDLEALQKKMTEKNQEVVDQEGFIEQEEAKLLKLQNEEIALSNEYAAIVNTPGKPADPNV